MSQLVQTGQTSCAVRNSEYIEWVREEVNALNYDTDERVIVTDGFKELGQRGEPQVVLMTQTSPDRFAAHQNRMASVFHGAWFRFSVSKSLAIPQKEVAVEHWY